MKKIIYTIAMVFCAILANAQVSGDYRSTGNVLLTTAANWQTYDGATWNAATQSPAAATLVSGNTVSILAGHTWSASPANNSATIPLGVSLLVQGTVGTLAANTLILNGTYIHNTTSGVANVFTGLAGNAPGTGSTFIYRATSAATPAASLNGRTYYNLIFDTDGSLAVSPSFSTPGIAADLTVNGDLTVNFWSASMPTAGANGLTATNFNGNILITNNGTFISRSATLLAGKTLTIDNGSKLGVGAVASGTTASILTINGTLINKSITTTVLFAGTGSVLAINGTYQHDANGGSIPNANTTYSATSTINVTGLTNVSNIPVLPTTTGNVIWNSPLQTMSNTFINTTSNSTTVNGNLTIESTGTAIIYLGGAGTGRSLIVNGNLIVNGGRLALTRTTTGGATGNQSAFVNGDVTVNSGQFYIADVTGATASTGVSSLTVTGNINQPAGLFGSAPASVVIGNLILSGTNATVNVTTPLSKTLLAINKGSGAVSLNTDAVLAAGSTLSLTQGKLIIAAGKTLEISSGNAIVADVSAFSASKYIVTAVSGANIGILKLSNLTATATTFPVGSATNYLPVTLTPDNTGDFTVSAFEGITTNGAPAGTAFDAARKSGVVDAVWQINRTAGTANSNVKLSWPASLEGAVFAGYINADVGISKQTGADWGIAQTNGNSNNTTNIAEANITDFTAPAAFAVGKTGTSLPIKITAFTAVLNSGKVNINWKVSNDFEMSKYIVERAGANLIFADLQIVNAVGAAIAQQYNGIDNAPLNGTNFYRIKALGKNGEVSYTSIAKIAIGKSGKASLSVYPNPVGNHILNISLNNVEADDYVLLLADNNGKIIYNKTLGRIAGTQTVNVPLQISVAAGNYRLIIKGNNTQLQQTVLIQ